MNLSGDITWFLIVIIFFYIFSSVVHAVFLAFYKGNPNKASIRRKRTGSARTLIVLGSGGHTAEMLMLLSELDFEHFSPRLYIVAQTDETSQQRVQQLEMKRKSIGNEFEILKISRSREVHQSWITTIFSTAVACIQSLSVLLKYKFDLILCNGPGTCVPICLASFILKAFWINQTTIVFIESICRVKSMSLTGKFMHFLADCCIVQWPDLRSLYPKTIYLGRLV